MSVLRLQKFLSQAGFCSRRKGEEYIKSGRVKINGKIISELGVKIDSAKDKIIVDGKIIKIKQKLIYIALNKPKGYVTSCNQSGVKIVLELVDIPERIYPVGRLDKDSTGLLILTNDGRLHHRLSHPSFDHEKEYKVTLAKPITDADLSKMERGLSIMGTVTRPTTIKRLSTNKFIITLKEGRNKQIRRMVEKVGGKVAKLKRIRIANIKLKGFEEGAWRYLSVKEKDKLLKLTSRAQAIH